MPSFLYQSVFVVKIELVKKYFLKILGEINPLEY